MLKVAAAILFLLAFIAPVVMLIFIIDRKRNNLIMFILGIAFYIVAETCIKLPALSLLGYGDTISVPYMLILCAAGAFFVEIIQYFVIKFNFVTNCFYLSEFMILSQKLYCNFYVHNI